MNFRHLLGCETIETQWADAQNWFLILSCSYCILEIPRNDLDSTSLQNPKHFRTCEYAIQ